MSPKMSRLAGILATVVLLAYFAFTSGAVYDLSRCDETNRLITPYSIPLSGDRTGLVGIFTEDDQRAAEWVVGGTRDKNIPVVCDGNIGMFLRSYQFADTVQLTYFTRAFGDEPHYLFIGTQNIRTRKVVTGAWTAGLRQTDPLPVITAPYYEEVFRCNDTVVYLRSAICR